MFHRFSTQIFIVESPEAENQQRAMEAAEKHNAQVVIPKARWATATATATPRCRKTMADFHDLMGFYGDLMEFNGILWWLNGIEPKKTKIYGDSMDI